MISNVPNNPDVIVVGAGTAGLAAADALLRAGKEVAVLEAADHTGGRCITETETFGIPFDHGGAWMHAANISPLVPMAREAGLAIHKTRWEYGRVRLSDGELSSEDVAGYSNYVSQMWQAANGDGNDVAIADVLPKSRWRESASNWIAQYLAIDASEASTGDYAAYNGGEGDWLVAGGLGGLIAHRFGHVPVKLNCPVTCIDWSGRPVTVETTSGNLQASQIIVTVSTGVLGSGAIGFTPELSSEKQQAIHDLPMGLLNKVGFLVDENWKEVREGYLVDYHKSDNAFCSLLFGFYNTGLAVGFTGGRVWHGAGSRRSRRRY